MRLREIRVNRRMTQEQFAETIDISVDFLSLIERGINAPSFNTLEKIARKLRLQVSDLFAFR
jgi:DNA-binding XRE family transcriptional regulator